MCVCICACVCVKRKDAFCDNDSITRTYTKENILI